jgi:uncharacterized small protein (DUF1192 family)
MKTLEDSLREALRQKDTQIADLQRQVQDGEANATQKAAELEGRIAALNTQRNELDAELRATLEGSGGEDRAAADALYVRGRHLLHRNDQLAEAVRRAVPPPP